MNLDLEGIKVDVNTNNDVSSEGKDRISRNLLGGGYVNMSEPELGFNEGRKFELDVIHISLT